MPIPIDTLTEEDYIKSLYKYETQGIGIYRHLSPERILSARWIRYKNIFFISDFGGAARISRFFRHRTPIYPSLIAWHKGRTKTLTFNTTNPFYPAEGKETIYLNIAPLVYKLFNGYPEDFKFENCNTRIEFYNSLVYDCRVENISLTNDYLEGYNMNDADMVIYE